MGNTARRFNTYGLKPLKRVATDFLFPPTCSGCGERVSEPGSICAACWQNIHFITAPYCPVMGIPFQFDPGDGFLSGEALQSPPHFDQARSAVVHGGLAQKLVTRLKYGDRTELAPVMARWMVTAAKDILASSDMIIPVPLHRWRFLARRYNQAAELARFIAYETHLLYAPHILQRHKATSHQVGLDAKARIRNVESAFSVANPMRAMMKGRNVLLIDDVYTTGATVNACARSLKQAGANSVFVLTFSRALHHSALSAFPQLDPSLVSPL